MLSTFLMLRKSQINKKVLYEWIQHCKMTRFHTTELLQVDGGLFELKGPAETNWSPKDQFGQMSRRDYERSIHKRSFFPLLI